MVQVKSRWIALWFWGLVALLPQAALAQNDVAFGKNKVNYSDYEWEYIQSEHFDIYFSHGSYRLAEFTAKEAERSLVRIEKAIKYTLHSRVPMVIYKSHNGFSETNISEEELPEGVGGFTEFAQNRVVIPYEGSYSQYRHVINHELVHAITFEQLTGGGGISSLLAQTASLPPLWVAEGMAEYLSLGWDKEADNMMRDATITGYVPPIDQIFGGLFAYKGGQSIFYMIEEKYGKDKIAEFESALRTSKTPEKALQASVGINVEKLSDEWRLWLKRRYWNDINLRKTPEESAKKLTDRKNDQSFFNLAPAFSPQGDKIAFLTDRRTYTDLYLMSAIDGKVLGRVVEGEKSAKFETMFLLRPGLSWSPDGREIAFIAKAGDKNALYTVNVKKKSLTRKMKFDLDGMFKPTWSPDGKQIVVMGMKDGMADLYTVNLGSNSIRRITNDPYEETDPQWSPDGKWIAFASDRPDTTLAFSGGRDFLFGKYDIFIMRADGSEMRRITDGTSLNSSPTWSPDSKKIAFISDQSGVGNIYIADLDSLVDQPTPYYTTMYTRPMGSIVGEKAAAFYSARDSVLQANRPARIKLPFAYPVTNLLASCQDLHWSPDGKKIAFSAFHNAGFDIYLLKDPTTHRVKDSDIPPTVFASHLMHSDKTDSILAKSSKDSLRVVSRPDSSLKKVDAANGSKADSVLAKSSKDSLRVAAVPDSSQKKPGAKEKAKAEGADDWVVEQGALASGETASDKKGEKDKKGDKEKSKEKGKKEPDKDEGSTASLDPSKVELPEKEFEIHKYKLKFKPELFAANAGFDTFYGVSGLAQLSVSDVLGNHRATFATGLNFSLKDSDFFATYAYLKHRTHYAGSLYHTRYFFYTQNQLAADRLYGMDLGLERPFNKFSRVETGVQFLNISRELIDNGSQNPFVRGGFFAGTTRGLSGQSLPTRRAYTTTMSLVNDNTLDGFYGPVDGSRSRLSFQRSWVGLRFNTVELDTRHYFRVLKDYTFAFRMAGGRSFGADRQVFFVGGVNQEINPRYATNSRLNDLNSSNVFFSRFVWPLRGLDLFEQAGDTYVLSNVEFRFPIIRQLQLGWPLPFFFQDVEGVLFFDVGGAFDWKSHNLLDVRDGGIILNGYNQNQQGGLAAGYGLGVRVNVGIFIFRYDLTWPTDLSTTFPYTGRRLADGSRERVGLKQYFSADIQGLF